MAQPIKASPGRSRAAVRRLLEQVLSWILRALAYALSFTLLPVNHFFGACVGRLLWCFDSDVKRVTQANLHLAYPDLSDQDHAKLAKASLRELGKTMTELGPLWCGSKQRLQSLVSEVRGQEIVDQAQAEGRGVVILAPHFGAWEMVGLYLSIQYKIVSLYRPPRLEGIESFTRQARNRFGAELVPTSISGVRALCRSLKQKRLIGILPDQDPGESGGIFAPFFGRPARTMILASRLAEKTNSEVVFCVAERLARGKGYRIHFIKGDASIKSKDDLVAVTALNQGVESIIEIDPTQYQWAYKRFRASPAGQTCTTPYQRKSRMEKTKCRVEPALRF